LSSELPLGAGRAEDRNLQRIGVVREVQADADPSARAASSFSTALVAPALRSGDIAAAPLAKPKEIGLCRVGFH
jgi:hypothetical protein